jgi:hypothetical protein
LLSDIDLSVLKTNAPKFLGLPPACRGGKKARRLAFESHILFGTDNGLSILDLKYALVSADKE